MKGTVYWFTGLSGSGKTTFGEMCYNHLRKLKPNVVFLDGDILREVYGSNFGHTLSERRRCAMINSRMCKMLSEQGIDVICATISMFDECRNWNRDNIENYIELYLRVPMEILIKRDPKGLYAKSLKGEIKNIYGIDLKVEEPKNPTIVIDNDGKMTIEEVFEKIMVSIKKILR